MDTTVIFSGVISIVVALLTSGIWALIAQRRQTAANIERTEKEAKKIEEETNKLKVENEKLKADTAQVIQDAAGDLISEYKTQNTELKMEYEKQTNKLKSELAKLRLRLASVEEELRSARVEINRLTAVNLELNRRIGGLEK